MTIKNTKLGGTDWTSEELKSDDLNDTIDATIAQPQDLGEVKMFALSVSGSVTKATLQSKGWAICDGTDIETTQGITGATITGNAPDLQEKFLRMSNDETSGTTGGKDNVKWTTPDGSSSSTQPVLGLSNSNQDERWYASATYDSSGSKTTFQGTLNEGARNGSVSSTSGTFYTETNVPSYYEIAFFIKVKVI